jgi:hypothetical protein
MTIHFEELWEQCEQAHKNALANDAQSSIIDELIMKINLYKAIDSKTEIPEEERKKIKSLAMGEILLSLTHLSFRDNINVFKSLTVALQFHK